MSAELEKYLRANSDIIRILEIVRELDLKDSWLCAGTIRNFIWNQYHFDKTTDVDIVFFDEGISYEKTLEIENHLHYMYPEYKWELKNQVFMHIHSPNSLPYQSSKDAIEKFPERCTAVGVRLLKEGNMELFAPFGMEDIYQYRVRPTPHFLADKNRMQLYKTRTSKKNWDHKWPQMIISFEE